MSGRIEALWTKRAKHGPMDPHERVKVMDAEGIDQTLIYPSLSLAMECTDAELVAANCRAYNNWVFDFCKTHPERLIPVAHIPVQDVEEGVVELRRTAKLGAKGEEILWLRGEWLRGARPVFSAEPTCAGVDAADRCRTTGRGPACDC